MSTPLSQYLSDDELREVLSGCETGEYEAWLPHPRWPYLVSSHGRIWSQRRGHLLKPFLQNGYPAVSIDGKNRRVHTLVLESFVSDRPKGMEVCHYDGDRTNNRLMNLRWDSRHGNWVDRYEGRQPIVQVSANRPRVRAFVARVVTDQDRERLARLRAELDGLSAPLMPGYHLSAGGSGTNPSA